MKVSLFSIRTILGFILGTIGLFAFALALLSGSIHRDLVLDNQSEMMAEMMRITTAERLNELFNNAKDLGLSLQSTAAFKYALENKDKNGLHKLLNDQFHQYFVTAGIIKLEQLVLFDKNFEMIIKSTDGSDLFSNQNKICQRLLTHAKQRTGSGRMRILQDLCLSEYRPVHVVIVPVGGLRIKGFVMVITNPIHNLKSLQENLGMPISLNLKNGENVFLSENWPRNKSNSFISKYELKTNQDEMILTILSAQNISSLSQALKKARLNVLLITGVSTLFIVLFTIFIMRKTMLNSLNRLTGKIRQFHENNSSIGEQLEVSGTKEIVEIVEGFNEMSRTLQDLYQSLEYMAYTDSLTKLPNRLQFHKQLETSISLHEKLDKPFALFLIDLDRFKEVNDTLGHHIGDELLKMVSARIKKILRSGDVVSKVSKESLSDREADMIARLGGDEFSVILASTQNLENSIVVAKKLIKATDDAFKVNDHKVSIGMSIGIAMYPVHGTDIHELLRHADIAMYVAKNNKTGYSVYGV